MATLKFIEPTLKSESFNKESFLEDVFSLSPEEGNKLISKSLFEAGNQKAEFNEELDILVKISELEQSEYKWPLELLNEYLTRNYHNYLVKKASDILNLTRRNYETDEEINPLIFNYNLHFLKLNEELNKHVMLREETTFPAIVQLLEAGSFPNNSLNLSLKDAINEGYEIHAEVVKELHYITKIRESFSVSGSFSSFHNKLNALSIEFEKAVQFQLHLEVNILYPEVIFLEEEAHIWE